MSKPFLIETIAEPLPGKRAQLVERIFIDGHEVQELTHEVGSPAPAATVKRYERTVMFS